MGKDARLVEEEVENMCPNSSLEQTAPSRKVQRHAKGRGNAAKSQGGEAVSINREQCCSLARRRCFELFVSIHLSRV